MKTGFPIRGTRAMLVVDDRGIGKDISFVLRQRCVRVEIGYSQGQGFSLSDAEAVTLFERIVAHLREMPVFCGKRQLLSFRLTPNVHSTPVALHAVLYERKGKKLLEIDKADCFTGSAFSACNRVVERMLTPESKPILGAPVSLEALRIAFVEINRALADLALLRGQAAAAHSRLLREMDELTAKAEASIKRIEEGRPIKDPDQTDTGTIRAVGAAPVDEQLRREIGEPPC